MRHPVWILNSALLFLFIIAAGFIFFSWQRPPEREDIEPELVVQQVRRNLPRANIEKIYENDLFGTYHAAIAPEQAESEMLMPEAPAPAPIKAPEKQTVQFLDPLAVTLKGIMTFSGNDSKNRAVLEDNATKDERLYKVGDKIEDAQLIRIFSNKIMFIRSNGQQEVLYLREKDALTDPSYMGVYGWADVIERVNESLFAVNPELFITRVQNLGQFIDMLDLTTAYKKGDSAGCRIGHLEDNSLGNALGLQQGDIIISVNDIPATTTSHRFKIYKALVSHDTHDTIKVVLRRNNMHLNIEYKLEKIKKRDHATEQEANEREQDRLKILQNKQVFAPTMQDIRIREKNYMREQGGKPATPLSNQAE